jgi:nicotinate-nucleotide pyrophosphorylase (carboxylating)
MSIIAGTKYILLDNMNPSEIKKSIKLKNTLKSRVKFEITGGIKLKNLKKFICLGADFISSSEITNCPKSVDIGMDLI